MNLIAQCGKLLVLMIATGFLSICMLLFGLPLYALSMISSKFNKEPTNEPIHIDAEIIDEPVDKKDN